MATEIRKILDKFADDRRELVAGAKKDARKMNGWRWHFVGRGLELIAIDETGERNDDLGGPEFIEVNDLTIKGLKETADHWATYVRDGDKHTLAKVALCYGLDVYDSFAVYMEDMKYGGCGDYTIWEDWAEAEIPISLLN